MNILNIKLLLSDIYLISITYLSILFQGGRTILKEDLEKILNEYLDAKQSYKNAENPIFKFIKNDFKRHLQDYLGTTFSLDSYSTTKNLGTTPRIKITDNTLTDQKFYLNLMYYFKADMSGLYLILKVPYDGNLKQKYGRYYSGYLRNKSTYIREFLKENYNLREDLIFSIDLATNHTKPKQHNKATIVAIYYDKNSIPSSEELISDIKYLNDLRKFILDNYTDQTEISVDEWVSALENPKVIDKKMFSILEIMQNMKDHQATTGQLIEKRKELGFENEKSYNSTIIGNSHRVKRFLNKVAFYNADGSENYWMRFFYGKDVRVNKDGKKVKVFQFKLKDELFKALGMISRKDELEDILESLEDNYFEEEIIETEKVDTMVEEKLFNSFYDYLLYKGYFFDKYTIENYLLSLKAKPFAILTGNSGTGKTKLSQLFAQYLMDNSQINEYLEFNEDEEDEDYDELERIDEGDSEEYISFKTTNSFLKDGFYSLGNKTLDVLLGLYNHDYYMNFTIDGIEAKLPLKINPSAKSYDKDLIEHLNSLDDLSEAEIKIRKKDIIESFSNQKPGVDKVLNFTRFRGEEINWSMPYREWENIINIKVRSKWDAIVDGLKTTFVLDLYSIVFDVNASENKSLKKHVIQKGLREKLSFTADLSSLEIYDKELNFDLERDFGFILLNDNEKIAYNSMNVENDKIDSKISSEYIGAKIRLNKDGSAAVTKYMDNILPLNDYQGRFDGFIDDVPVKLGFNVVAYLRFGKKFITNNLVPKYAEDDEIDIKINVNDIKGFVSKPNFSGLTELNFTIGSFPEYRVKAMSKDDHLRFFNINDKLKDCEVIVDGQSTIAKFYLSDTIICLKSEEADNYIEELSKRDKNSYFTIKIDLDSFKPHYPNGRGGPVVIGGGIDSFDTNYKIIPVGANWTENRHIVGYYNVITNEYQSTPAYDLIKAANNSTEPYFLILDEMNLSHVERYFADFLSAIESGEKIPLYGDEELTLPQNLFIIGTVNVDETTYMFSPKVLDRANVIEFETYSALDYMNNKINLDAPNGDISYLEDPLAGNYIRDYGIDELRDLFQDVTADGNPFWNILTDEIFKFQEILKESGFDFGFRVINEIVRFMAVAWEYEDKPEEFTIWSRYFDACIKQKLLPKLHGSEKIIGETLDKLYANCVDNSFDTKETSKYPESAKKLKEMREVLRKQRYVSFIN